MKKSPFQLILTIVALLGFCQLAQAQDAIDSVGVKAVLEQQVTAWNNGNVQGFMQGYWNNPKLAFVSKKGVTLGWENTLQKYLKSYPDKAAMGQLTFSNLSFIAVDATAIVVNGKWELTRNADHPEGYFTLLFRKINGTWLIVLDHTS